MVSMGREKAYICLGEVIGDTWQEYILTIAINKPMKIVSDSCDPIHFVSGFKQKITLHIISSFTPKQFQLI